MRACAGLDSETGGFGWDFLILSEFPSGGGPVRSAADFHVGVGLRGRSCGELVRDLVFG